MQQENVESEEHGRRYSEFLAGSFPSLNRLNHVGEIFFPPLFSLQLSPSSPVLLVVPSPESAKQLLSLAPCKCPSPLTRRLLWCMSCIFYLQFRCLYDFHTYVFGCMMHPDSALHTHRHADTPWLPLLIYPSGCLSAQEKAQS